MLKKILIGLLALIIVGTAGYVWLGQSREHAAQAQDAPSATPVTAPIESSPEIIAEGKLVPANDVEVAFVTGGVVDEVLVAEGDVVEAGQPLARLGRENLEVARQEAQSALRVAELRLAQLEKGPDDKGVAIAEAAVNVARAGVTSAEAGVSDAEAKLARVKAGPTAEDIAIAERRVEQTKNALWGAQGRRDAVCGRVGRGAQSADCDSAQASVQQAEEEVRIAELQLQQMAKGPSQEDIATAQAGLERALGQLASAEAQVQKAEADLERALEPAQAEDIAVAAEQVEQARIAVNKAKMALEDTVLVAPVDGTVVTLEIKAGEYVSPGKPVVHLADLAHWQIETTDLNELNVIRIQEGDPAVITFDALPDLEIKGQVTRIRPMGGMYRGEIAYTVIITPQELDPRLRWNMTAAVTITPAE